MVSLQLDDFIAQLTLNGYTVVEEGADGWLQVSKGEGYLKTDIIKFNRYVPWWFKMESSTETLDEEDYLYLIPAIFNLILRSLSLHYNQLMVMQSGDQIRLEIEKEQLLGDLIDKEANNKQELMERLAALDKKLDIEDVYINGYIVRMLDLFAILQDYGYTESVIEGTTLSIIKHRRKLVIIDTDSQMDMKTMESYDDLPEDEQIKLQLLLTSYAATPVRVRKVGFSFLEQALIASLPSQYRWLKREHTSRGLKLYALSSLDALATREEVVCDPKLFRTVTVKNPLPTYMNRKVTGGG